jgi:hypothetical protein
MTNAEKEKIKEKIEEGSIYTDPRYKKWRDKVYKRDGHACQYPDCKYPMGSLNAHHIKMKWYFPELMFTLTNGITLCEYHHKYIHKRDSNNFVEFFNHLAIQNTLKPKVRKKAKKLSKRSTKTQLKNARRKKGKKRIIRTVRSKIQLTRTLQKL